MIEKSELQKMMLPQMERIVQTWNNYGIIIETQFQFAYQHMFKTSYSTAYQIIVENGGYLIERDEEDWDSFSKPLCTATEVDGEGWMYAFYDPTRVNCTRVHQLIRKYFTKSCV